MDIREPCCEPFLSLGSEVFQKLHEETFRHCSFPGFGEWGPYSPPQQCRAVIEGTRQAVRSLRTLLLIDLSPGGLEFIRSIQGFWCFTGFAAWSWGSKSQALWLEWVKSRARSIFDGTLYSVTRIGVLQCLGHQTFGIPLIAFLFLISSMGIILFNTHDTYFSCRSSDKLGNMIKMLGFVGIACMVASPVTVNPS